MALSPDDRVETHRRHPPIVAEVDGEAVGFVAVGPSRDEGTDRELFAIYVHPNTGTERRRVLIEAGEERVAPPGTRMNSNAERLRTINLSVFRRYLARGELLSG